MVLTRSRAASPAPAGALPQALPRPPSPGHAPESAPRATVAAGAALADDGLAGASAAGVPYTTQASPVHTQFDAAGVAAAPVVMSTEQLLLLINRLSRSDPVSTSAPISSGNFAKCTARFDGGSSSNSISVEAFIDAVETYKACLNVDDGNALRGLSMLLTGLAATWWQGIKDTTLTWGTALDALKQTFGPRLPPHKLYRKIFEREQRVDEPTDLFLCHIRALFAQLPEATLTETVQLDMIYGLLHRRLREKVPRSSFVTFAELLVEARRTEDILDESKARSSSNTIDTKPVITPTPTPTPRVPAKQPTGTSTNRFRFQCRYCKQYGHPKDACPRLTKPKTASLDGDTAAPPNVTCFGCGSPGVIRSNCPKCKERKPVVPSSFQSVFTSSGSNMDSRVRPVIGVEIYQVLGNLLVDTGAKLSVGSVSLREHLVKNGHEFTYMFTQLKYADGRTCAQEVEVAHVEVTVNQVITTVTFIMLPNANESLLGMNFIEDVGMILDFKRGFYSLGHDATIYPIIYESRSLNPLVCSSVGLREDEGSRLRPDERGRLSTLLDEYEDIFAPGGEPTPFAVHRIDTGDAAPIASPPYRVTPVKKEIIRMEIDKMLSEDIIEEAESEWASPVVLIPKKNGEVRFCVDYRKLNSVTRTDKYPLPVIDELLQSTKANCIMSTIDLKAGYWQTLVAPEDRHKTTFTSPFGNFQFRRMAFGLKNAPATFQRMIDRMRSGLNDVCVLAYLDDLLVISSDLNSHLQDLQQVFERLKLFNLKANRSKCVFARDRITYLGHVVSSKGIEPDPTKVQAVMDMKPPTNVKELKTFLQTCSWFRKFIPQFSEIAKSLTDLTKKDRRWHWGEDEMRAFEKLKLRLSTSPILRQPDFDEPFVLRTDASAYAIGAVLMQGAIPPEERPLEYASRLLTPAERNYNTTEREALAVVWALDKFRGYVEGSQVKVATDHQPLKWLLTLKTPSGRLARWAMKIQSYNLDVDYTPGRANVVADTLSRPVESGVGDDSTPCSVCPVVVDLPQRNPEDIRDAQLSDPDVAEIIKDFEYTDRPEAANRWTDRGYFMSHGILYRFDLQEDNEEPQLVIPESLKGILLKELHDAPTAGHLGLERTLRKIRERYYFKNMRTYVTQYLKTCDLCQKYKPTNLKPAGLLQTPVPQQRFEVLAMDLFGPLPEGDKGERWIFLVEDTASRWVELFALCDSTADTCAKVLIEEVFLRYGLPRRIISDNGVQFVSTVMQKAMFVLGIHQSLTSVYHPEANPAERKNRELKQRLAMLVGSEHRRWPAVLPTVRFTLNSSPNQGTGRTAAFLTFGRELRSPIAVNTDLRVIISQQNFVPQITPYSKDFARVLHDVRNRIENQQDLRKAAGDQRRRDVVPFQVGDLVLVETHLPSNAAKGFTNKFAPKREGPYQVSKVASPTSFLITDSSGVVKGKYHASALTSYVGSSPAIVHQRQRGRPPKSKSPPGRAGDLEGEVIACENKVSDCTKPYATVRRSSRLLERTERKADMLNSHSL